MMEVATAPALIIIIIKCSHINLLLGQCFRCSHVFHLKHLNINWLKEKEESSVYAVFLEMNRSPLPILVRFSANTPLSEISCNQSSPKEFEPKLRKRE